MRWFTHKIKKHITTLAFGVFLFMHPKLSEAGYWVCTYNVVGTNDRKYMMFNRENIALMYLGHHLYYNGKVVKIHLHQNYDTLTATMYGSVGLNYNSYIYIKNMYNSFNNPTRYYPEFVLSDLEMVVKMKQNSPSIGYVNKIMPFYDVSQCLVD